jgi:Host cell surface-exposed lipoprotein
MGERNVGNAPAAARPTDGPVQSSPDPPSHQGRLTLQQESITTKKFVVAFEDFSNSEARWAVAHVRVSWNAEAVESAKQYLRVSSFSRQGLIEQLEFEGFTHSQAAYGVSKAYR